MFQPIEANIESRNMAEEWPEDMPSPPHWEQWIGHEPSESETWEFQDYRDRYAY